MARTFRKNAQYRIPVKAKKYKARGKRNLGRPRKKVGTVTGKMPKTWSEEEDNEFSLEFNV